MWLSIAAAVAFSWRAALTWRQWHLPPRWLLVLLVIAGTVGVFLQYRTIMGRTPGIALLVVFLALKLLELRAARDAVATALLCYFLVLGQFLFTQTIPTALLAGLTILITTATLLAASDDRPQPQQQLRRAALMLAQAMPFMLLGGHGVISVTANVAPRLCAEFQAATLAGDRSAYGRIVERYQRLLCSLAFSATGGLAQSEDLAQETFIDAWRQLFEEHFETLSLEPHAFKAGLWAQLYFRGNPRS